MDTAAQAVFETTVLTKDILGGIVGPILIWRASRADRHIALESIDSSPAESGGFLTKGLRVWPGIHLLRRVRAPV
jgi:hypothetical protein